MSNAIQKHEASGGQVVAINDNAALAQALMRAAADPAVDVEKMERLWAMHERMEDRRASQEFSEAMSEAQREMPLIGKDRHNTQTNSDYATLDAINAQIVPVYTRHGFSLTFDTCDSPLADHVRVVCRVKHRGGHTETYTHDNPMDMTGIGGKVNKTATHGRGSAITYARRYLTLLIFNLRTGYDDDGNASSGYDSSDWVTAIDDASDMDALNQVGEELKAASIPAEALKGIRRRWAARAKELRA